LAESCRGFVKIERNSLIDCGLDTDQTLAVIEVNCPQARAIDIENNKYQGNSKTLKYFIRCFQNSPTTSVNGNTTPTHLPNLIGP
jgi:hypothetical protein